MRELNSDKNWLLEKCVTAAETDDVCCVLCVFLLSVQRGLLACLNCGETLSGLSVGHACHCHGEVLHAKELEGVEVSGSVGHCLHTASLYICVYIGSSKEESVLLILSFPAASFPSVRTQRNKLTVHVPSCFLEHELSVFSLELDSARLEKCFHC